MNKLLIGGLAIGSVVIISMWKFEQNRAELNQRAIECISFVQKGIDLTGKGKNNCTSPELIPDQSNQDNISIQPSQENIPVQSNQGNISIQSPDLVNSVPNTLSGNFRDSKWEVSISADASGYRYTGKNLVNGEYIRLADGKEYGDDNRHVLTWNNDGYTYKVTQTYNQPNLINLKVIEPNGNTALNRNLER